MTMIQTLLGKASTFYQQEEIVGEQEYYLMRIRDIFLVNKKQPVSYIKELYGVHQ